MTLRRISLVGLAALTVVLSFTVSWSSMWTRLVVLPGARKELRDVDYHPYREELRPNLRQLVEAWEDGDRSLAELLIDRDGLVWVKTAELIEMQFSGMSHFRYDWKKLTALRRELHGMGAEYSLRFHLIDIVNNVEWRSGYFVADTVYDWRYFWTSYPGTAPGATPELVRFLEEVIREWPHEQEDILHDPLIIRSRAVDALIAMWEGALERGGDTSTLERTIASLIQDDTELDAEVRHRAARRALQSCWGEGKVSVLSLLEWEEALGLVKEDTELEEQVGIFGGSWEPEWEKVEGSAFEALLLLKHERVAKIIDEARERPDLAKRLEDAEANMRQLPEFLRSRYTP